jgi:hypothetical protein
VLNEEENMFNLLKTGAFVLFMLTIGVVLGSEWAIILLLSLIYTKEG